MRERGDGALVNVNVGETVGGDGDAAVVGVAVGDTAGEAGGEADDGAFAGETVGEAVGEAVGCGIGRRRGRWVWARPSV